MNPTSTLLTPLIKDEEVAVVAEEEEEVIHKKKETTELPPIPVMMRHPHIIASVKQYRLEAQNEQLQTHIVSESFIPMSPNVMKPPRKRRRPPFSYSSLIVQAILESENERMTLRDIYTWITKKYPALYNAEDTGWQNTIRHNLSLNRCFKKIPKSELTGNQQHRGKGGYWTIDPVYLEKFKNGSFSTKGTASLMKRDNNTTLSPSPTLPDTPISTIAQTYTPTTKDESSHSTTENINNKPCPIMQIHNLL
ncbi:fork head domain-containing protein, partial [Cokeromyces recurvatus]|uniref:fork head domain-containing protein n=1 Tax=Cokeromyces recurvatus TaxID=90255 RepID=UPI00221E875B